MELPEEGWTYENPSVFSFDILDTTKRHDLILTIDHSTDYEYQNLYLKIETVFPDGQKKEQVLSVDVTTKAGVWNGKCGSKKCELQVNLQRQARFEQLGEYKITINQHMRISPLPNLQSIGLRITN